MQLAVVIPARKYKERLMQRSQTNEKNVMNFKPFIIAHFKAQELKKSLHLA